MTAAADRLALFAMGIISSRQLAEEIMGSEAARSAAQNRRRNMTREHHPHDHQTHETRVRFYHKLVTADQATKQGWMATWNSLDNAHRQSIIENGELSGLTAALRGVGLSAEDVGHLSGGGSLYDPGAVGFASTEEALAKFGIAS